MKKPVVELKSVSVERGQKSILNSVDLTINEGDFIMLIGPNGSGKSTLLKTLNGAIRPTRGQVMVNGVEVTGAPVHKIAMHVATLTQDVQQSTFSELSVAMNLDLALERAQRRLSLDDKMAYLTNFSETLKERMNVAAGKLSGGQRQALALAMCMAHQPKVLLLDEHTSALDPKAAKHLMNVTNDYIAQCGVTTVMISHHLDHVLNFGNRVLVINEGLIVADLDDVSKQELTLSDLVAFAY